MQAHYALDEGQIGFLRGALKKPARIGLAASAEVDILAGMARGQRVDLRVEKVGAALEDAHSAALARMQTCERGDYCCLALARGRCAGRSSGCRAR